MCNPRRVEVTATRQVRESWERELHRIEQVSSEFTGQARVRQPLDASVGAPALMALQARLARGVPGWALQEDGTYRHAVEGGHVLYHPDDRSLEIVAEAREEIHEEGMATERVGGEIDTELRSTANADYYDDGYAGRTEERARAEAQARAERELQEATRAQLDAAAQAAEQARDADLRERARGDARARAQARGEALSPELARRARARLGDVGLRARQSFHRLLAEAYRDALTALARRRGVADEDIIVRDSDGYLDIELRLPD